VDFLQALAEDKETKVIAGYPKASRRATSSCVSPRKPPAIKPVVILKVGITPAGAKAAFLPHRQPRRC